MAGIYIHIPFCKTRCIYCDFYSTTRSELKQQYIRALCTELKTRKGYLKEEPIETIYFGGGTPSQLAHEDFEQIFRTIKEVYGTEHAEEITLEANPDDLTEEYVSMLRTLPFNRISMGIQMKKQIILKNHLKQMKFQILILKLWKIQKLQVKQKQHRIPIWIL